MFGGWGGVGWLCKYPGLCGMNGNHRCIAKPFVNILHTHTHTIHTPSWHDLAKLLKKKKKQEKSADEKFRENNQVTNEERIHK
jgi:hypothetical protein